MFLSMGAPRDPLTMVRIIRFTCKKCTTQWTGCLECQYRCPNCNKVN